MPQTTPGLLEDAEYLGSWFNIELKNGISGHFTDISGLAIEVALVEKTDTDSKGNTMTRRRPGTTSYGELTLKRTLSADKGFFNWVKQIRDGAKNFRSEGAVVLYDIAGTETGRWTFTNVWPSKWSASDLDVGSDDLIQEEVVLQIELLTRAK